MKGVAVIVAVRVLRRAHGNSDQASPPDTARSSLSAEKPLTDAAAGERVFPDDERLCPCEAA